MHRHAYKGRKLQREKAHRSMMLRNLATSVLLHEKVKTTLPKAKEIRSIVESLITSAKAGDLTARRKLSSYLLDKNAVEKALRELGPLYEKRNGGYTRIIKAGSRVGDNAPMAYIELLDTEKLIKKEMKKELQPDQSKSEVKEEKKRPRRLSDKKVKIGKSGSQPEASKKEKK